MLTLLKRRYLLYVPILVGASGLLFLRTFLYARVFPVESFGLFNQAVLIATTFTSLAGLGLYHLAQKLLPQHHALGEREKFDDLVSSCVTVCGISAIIAGVVLAAALALGWLHRDLVFVAVLPYAIAQFLFMIRLNEIKSELRFLDHSRLSAMRAVALLFFGVAVAALTQNVAATLVVETLATLVIAAPLITGERGRRVLRQLRALRTHRDWLAAYYPAAVRLFLLSGATTALYLVDRWSGVALLTKHQYGIFALGLTIVALFETLQVIVNVAAYPLMGRMVARGERRRAFQFATFVSFTVIGVGVACYIPFVLMLDILLRTYLPSYIEAADVVRLAVIVGILRLADFYTAYMVLLDFERCLTIAYAVLFIAAIVAIAVASSSGIMHFDPARMMAVSVCIAVCLFVLNLMMATYASRRTIQVDTVGPS